MVGNVALYFQNHFKNWSKFNRVFSFDETMLFTVVVSASRSSLTLLVVELTKELKGCNSSLSRKQFDAGESTQRFVNLRSAECVCSYYGLRVCSQTIK